MPLFTSFREKRYWLYALLVILAIFLTLLLDRPFGHFMRDENIQAAFFMIGVLDECVQWFLPNRVFDTNDMIFNALAAFMSIAGSQFLIWLRRKVKDD